MLEAALRDPTCGNESGGRIDRCEAFSLFLQSVNLVLSINDIVLQAIDDGLQLVDSLLVAICGGRQVI